MVDQNDDNEIKKRKDGETEGKGSAGKGRVGGTGTAGGAGAEGSGGIRFSIDATTSKQIWAEWKHLNMAEAIMAVAEFFSELPARASANMVVVFDGATKAGFAIVSQTIRFGQDMVVAMRTRSREATAVIRRKYGINIKTKKAGVTVIAPNPGVT